jgi:hypothetical protein
MAGTTVGMRPGAETAHSMAPMPGETATGPAGSTIVRSGQGGCRFSVGRPAVAARKVHTDHAL